jgi:hypothetical protein
MEEVISELLAEHGFVHQPKRFVTPEDEEKSCDQYFSSPDAMEYYLVEQKVRDDHDSSKKKGQFKNFLDKITYLRNIHGSALTGIMYFIDPSLRKNRNYYKMQLEMLSADLSIPLYLFYNGELFDFLGIPDGWRFIETALPKWQQSVPVNIEFDFDSNPEESWRAIQILELGVWYKLLKTDALWEGYLTQTLFSNGTVLRLLLQTFKQQGAKTIKLGNRKVNFDELAYLLEKRLKTVYNDSSN